MQCQSRISDNHKTEEKTIKMKRTNECPSLSLLRCFLLIGLHLYRMGGWGEGMIMGCCETEELEKRNGQVKEHCVPGAKAYKGKSHPCNKKIKGMLVQIILNRAFVAPLFYFLKETNFALLKSISCPWNFSFLSLKCKTDSPVQNEISFSFRAYLN